MSDYVANAFVLIKPETKGFEASLRSQVNTAVAKVNAKVLVGPSTTGFQAALRTQVQAAIGKVGPQTIPVIPKVAATGEVQAALSEQRLKVPLVPDFSGFQAQITERITAINAALPPIEVPVGAVDVGDLTGEVAQRKAVAEASNEIAEAKRREAQLTQQLARQTQLQNAADTRSAAIKKTLEPIERARRTSAVQLEAAFKQQAGSESQLLSLETSRRTISEALEKTEVELRAATGATNAELRKRLLVVRERIISEKQLVDQEIRSASALSAEATATKLAATASFDHAQASKIEKAALVDVAAIREANIVLKEAEKSNSIALKAARTAENETLIAQLTLMETELATRRELVTEQQKQVVSQQSLASQQKLLGRGAASTALSFLGIRGATLAASGAFLAGAAAVAAFAKSVKSAADLEQELNVFAVTAKATTDELQAAGEVARQLGADITLPAVSASDAAEAFSSLAKAGLDVQNALDGARGVLQLATAAQISNADATELVASALNAFSLAGEDAVRVADLLAGASVEAQGSIADMGIALQQASAVSRQAGLSLEDTVAFITLLAQAGLRGSDAGTSLRTSLLRLIAPTRDAQKELAKLNVTVLDANGAVRPEVFSELQVALESLDATVRNQTLRKIFGQDAIRAAVIFGRAGVDGLNAVRSATGEVGLAAELAGARTQGFSGKVEALSNSLATLGTTLGQVTLGPLGSFVDTLSEIIGVGNDAIAVVKDLNKTSKEGFTGGDGGGDGGGIGGFLSNVKDDLLISGGDLIREARAQFQILEKNIPQEAFESGTRAIARYNSETLKTVTNTKSLSAELQKVGTGEAAITFLENMSDKLTGNSEAAVRAREQISQLTTLIVGLGRLPTVAELDVFLNDRPAQVGLTNLRQLIKNTKFDIQLSFAEGSAKILIARAKATGENAADLWIKEWKDKLSPKVYEQILKEFFNISPKIIEDEADKVGGIFSQTLNTALAVAVAEGNDQVQLDILQKQLAATRKRRARLQRQAEKQGGPAPNLDAGIRAQAEEETRLQGEIERIQKDRAAKSKSAADSIQKARDDADQAFLDALGINEGNLSQRQLAAQATAGLSDDIAANAALQKFFQDQIKRAQATLKDALARTQTVQALTRQLTQAQIEGQKLQDELRERLTERIDLRLDIATAQGDSAQMVNLLRQRERIIRAAIREARKLKDSQKVLALELELVNTAKQIRDTIQDSIRLDIEFANIQGNVGGEIAARQRLISNLKKQQSLVRKGTAEWKRLRNEIAQEQKAIEELRKQTEEGKGTTAFELLRQNAETFAQIAGDLTNFNQPFGEVSDFTVDLSKLLTRPRPGFSTEEGGTTRGPGRTRLPAGITRGDSGGPPQRPVAGLSLAEKEARAREVREAQRLDRLIAALDANTAALTGKDPKKDKKKSGAASDHFDVRWQEASANRRVVGGRI